MMHRHENTKIINGIERLDDQERKHWCPDCDNDGIVIFDDDSNEAAPCPRCTYGKLKARRWTVDRSGQWEALPESIYQNRTWENGVTLRHTSTCSAPSDSRRYPNGYLCRRPSIPSASGMHHLCDVHRTGQVPIPPVEVVEQVATAREQSSAWEAQRESRRLVEGNT